MKYHEMTKNYFFRGFECGLSIEDTAELYFKSMRTVKEWDKGQSIPPECKRLNENPAPLRAFSPKRMARVQDEYWKIRTSDGSANITSTNTCRYRLARNQLRFRN